MEEVSVAQAAATEHHRQAGGFGPRNRFLTGEAPGRQAAVLCVHVAEGASPRAPRVRGPHDRIYA